jgi:hypothetical protein
MSKQPISFNVPPKLWEPFRRQTEGLSFSRASFLDDMIRAELPNLREDLAGLRLSTRAKRFIAGEVKRTGPVSVNIEVQPETADALREAEKEHNLVRSAFMSRLILLLRSSDALLDLLQVPRTTQRVPGAGAWLEELPSSPMKAMEAIRDDPLFYVRWRVKENWGQGVYRLDLLQFPWATCYLDDEQVPGTAAYRKRRKEEALIERLL